MPAKKMYMKIDQESESWENIYKYKKIKPAIRQKIGKKINLFLKKFKFNY